MNFSHRWRWWWWWWVWLWLWLTPTPRSLLVSGLCPSECRCTESGGGSGGGGGVPVPEAECGGAGLDVVPIQLNPELGSLSLEGNKISSLHYTLQIYSKLTKLGLSRNRLASLGARNFEAQLLLTRLDVSHNLLSRLGPSALRGLRSLLHLDLSHNRLEDLEERCFKDLGRLETLDLSHNRLSYLGGREVSSPLLSLKSLDLSSNSLGEVPSAFLRALPIPCALETLDLSDNSLWRLGAEAWPDPCFSSLVSLDLSGNPLEEVARGSFRPLTSLRSLRLADNNLSSVPTGELSRLSELESLALDGNPLSELGAVAFQSLFRLRRLSLRRLPRLERIHGRALVDNAALEELLLEECARLGRLPPRLLQPLPKLTSLSLRGNALRAVDPAQLPVDRLRLLDLSENPLECNCSLRWLWLLSREEAEAASPGAETPPGNGNRSLELRSPERTLCAGPPPLASSPVLRLPESALSCQTSWLAVAVVTSLTLALFAATCTALLLFGGGGGSRGESGPPAVGVGPAASKCRRPPPPGTGSHPPPPAFDEPWIGVGAPPLPLSRPHVVYV